MLDLSADFDMVDHPLLLEMLRPGEQDPECLGRWLSLSSYQD